MNKKAQSKSKTKYPLDWHLSELYKGVADPKIISDLQSAKKSAEAFEKKHRGKLKKYTAKQILDFFRQITKLQEKYYLTELYVDLLHSLNTADPAANSLLQKAQVAATAAANHLIFVDLELAKHPKLKHFAADPKMEPFNIIFRDLAIAKKHQLSHAEETVLNMKGITSRAGWIKLFEQLMADQKYEIILNGKSQRLGQEKILDLMHSSDRRIRERVAASIDKGLQQQSAVVTQINSMVLTDKMQNDALRKFSYPEERQHISNNLTKKTVDTLVAVTRKNYKVVSRYYNLKRKLLGLDIMYDYDRYAPITMATLVRGAGRAAAGEQKYSYPAAVEIVHNAFRAFDPQLAEIFMDLVRSGHVDVLPKPGKRTGAFATMLMAEGHKPYVFLNYMNKARDVQTLAHEMGHAIHGVLSARQPLLVALPPLALCETASVFGEMVVFEDLLKRTKTDQEKIILLSQKIDDTIATIFRQAVMFMFEQKVHNYFKENSDISYEKFGEFWMEMQREMYGKSVELTEGYSQWWSYIPHFIHTPFYVYSYAFGNLLVFALYEKYRSGEPNFVANYKKFLGLGGSKTPQEAVDIFGFNLEDPAFWQSGFNVLQGLVDQLENLVKAR